MQTSDKIDLISAALVTAQGDLEHASKDSTNPHFKSKYADIAAIWDAAKPVLKANDLAALQDVSVCELGVGVRTRIIHKSGQWIEFDPPYIPLSKKDAHGVGSAITYGRRYSLAAALGVVADEDDDGNEASKGNSEQPPKSPPGVSKARTEVTNAVRELGACADEGTLMGFLSSADMKRLAVKICKEYPDLWIGPENSGLAPHVTRAGEECLCTNEANAWLRKVEGVARAKEQQAAE
jgi:hypothetical protein